jgi:hypothetical protein
MPAAHVQIDRDGALRRTQLDAAAEMRQLVAPAHLGGALDAEVAHATAGEEPAPVAREFVVRVDHRDASGAQRVEYRGVLPRHRSDVFHEFLVLALRVVDERDRRARDRRKSCRLAGMIHPYFDHRGAVGLAQAKHGQRQADVVVEIPLGHQRLHIAEVRAQNRRDHLLDGGLAVRPRHGDERDIEAGAPLRRQPPQAQSRVADDEERKAGRLRREFQRIVDHRRGGAAFPSDGEKTMAVEALAPQRDEQRSAPESPAVGRDREETCVGACQPRADRCRGFA